MGVNFFTTVVPTIVSYLQANPPPNIYERFAVNNRPFTVSMEIPEDPNNGLIGLAFAVIEEQNTTASDTGFDPD